MLRARAAIPGLVACLIATPALAQRATSRADSALVARILLAEDQRDSAGAAFAEGARHADQRIRIIARRAEARVRDPRFAARDSMPAPAAPPAYADPAWRLRLRALAATRGADCALVRAALADSAWPVRLRAADLAGPACSGDTVIVGTLRAWAATIPTSGARTRGGVSWHPAAHALVALARVAPAEARALLPAAARHQIPWMRAYAARAADALADTATLRRLGLDPDDNVKEAAIDALSRAAGHTGDDVYLAALSARGYQAVRAGARALRGSPRGADVVRAALAAALRLRRDSSETSRDARAALLERIGEFATPADAAAIVGLAADFDCAVARAAAEIAARLGNLTEPACTPLPLTLPPDAVALALGREVRLRVVLADSSGGGSFTVRLRGDVAPTMAARILALARSGWYNGLTWHRVEPDFVLQGGGGGNEYLGHPRFIRDELGGLAHPRGTVGMSTRGHDTGDAQWFINLRDNPRLRGDYTVFAEVVESIEVVDGMMEADVIARIEVVP